MHKVKFAYNEPRIEEIEVEDSTLSDEDLIREIEAMYPEAIDIEILEVEEIFDV